MPYWVHDGIPVLWQGDEGRMPSLLVGLVWVERGHLALFC